MKIAFLILAHDNPESIIETARFIVSHGHNVIVHFDSSSAKEDLLRIQQEFEPLGANAHVVSEVHCAWGEWSLVEAPLRCLRLISNLGWKCEYVHLMSSTESFIKPMQHLEQFLSENSERDFIESVDIKQTKWVKGGLELERFQYFYPFSFINQTRRFSFLTKLQRIIGIPRKIPANLQPRMGSQWWTLRFSTCQKILQYIDRTSAVAKYFKTTWIPDESFFQTIVAHLIPAEEIAQVQLVFHWLTPYGRPFVFRNGHEKLVGNLPHFTIRKISPAATALKKWIDEQTKSTEIQQTPSISDLRSETIRSHHLLNSKGSFKQEAIFMKDEQFWTSWPDFLVQIFHTKEQIPELLQALSNMENSIKYIGRPFEKPDKIEEKQQQSYSIKLAHSKLLATLSRGATKINVASIVIGEDRFPDSYSNPQGNKIASIALSTESKIVDSIYSNLIARQYDLYPTPISIADLPSQLQILENHQNLQTPK